LQYFARIGGQNVNQSRLLGRKQLNIDTDIIPQVGLEYYVQSLV